MSKIVLKIGLILSILSVVIILTGMSFNSSIDNRLSQKLSPDTLKTINNYQVTLLKDETIDVNINDWDSFVSNLSSYYKEGENQRISSGEYYFNFSYSELIENNGLVVPEELNIHNSKSSTNDLKSLTNFTFSKYRYNYGYENKSSLSNHQHSCCL